jgi:peptidoglycan/xylan/chitin deacetylase (PgdA/CDA1 family)
VIALSDLVDYLKGRRESLPQKSVVITVDDGWLSAYTEIFPMLQQRHMPFTLCIYPQIVGKGKDYVTWPQIAEMASHGVDIEDHTFTHPFLKLRRNHEVKPEDYDRFLEHELLARRKTSNFDRVVQSAVEHYGYEAAVYDRDKGAFIGRGTSPMDLIRFPVVHDTTLEQFEGFLVP